MSHDPLGSLTQPNVPSCGYVICIVITSDVNDAQI